MNFGDLGTERAVVAENFVDGVCYTELLPQHRQKEIHVREYRILVTHIVFCKLRGDEIRTQNVGKMGWDLPL